jgi:hypothetical protein
VFVDEDGVPVAVDFAPGGRSPGYAAAVVVADAVVWHRAEPALVERIGLPPPARALVARALRFRLVAEQLALADGIRPAHGAETGPYRRVLAQLA